MQKKFSATKEFSGKYPIHKYLVVLEGMPQGPLPVLFRRCPCLHVYLKAVFIHKLLFRFEHPKMMIKVQGQIRFDYSGSGWRGLLRARVRNNDSGAH